MSAEHGNGATPPSLTDSPPLPPGPEPEPPACGSFLPPEDLPLWDEARALRERYWGRKVFLRGIVELSNHCRQNCLYCGLRRDNAALARYRMDLDDVFAAAETVKRLGFGTVVLQAGEDPGLTPRALAGLVMRIKRDLGLAVTLSLGEWEPSVYALWRKSGADRYLLKLETPDESLYARLRPGRTLEERVNALRILADLGYETGSGFITGLPDGTDCPPAGTDGSSGHPETPAVCSDAIHNGTGASFACSTSTPGCSGSAPGYANSLLDAGFDLLATLQPDMVSLGPFVPHPGTPLGNHFPGSAAESLRAMAKARVRIPAAHIPVTSALGLHGDAMRLAALEVGNVLMPSLTPESVRDGYAIYPGKNADERSPEVRAAAFRPLLEGAGFTVSPGSGGAWRLIKRRVSEA